MTTPRTLAAVLLAATLALSGCGDDKKDTASSQFSDSNGSGTGNATDSDAAAPAGSDVGFKMPAVTANATDLSKEPKAGKGTGNGPATVQTKDLVVGKGKVAKAHDSVTVHYVGSLFSNGTVFDSSWGGAPAPFSLDEVVPGFAKGIEGMKIGGRRIIVIPSDLAYGPAGSPPVIPPNAVLVFIVDLKKVS